MKAVMRKGAPLSALSRAAAGYVCLLRQPQIREQIEQGQIVAPRIAGSQP